MVQDQCPNPLWMSVCLSAKCQSTGSGIGYLADFRKLTTQQLSGSPLPIAHLKRMLSVSMKCRRRLPAAKRVASMAVLALIYPTSSRVAVVALMYLCMQVWLSGHNVSNGCHSCPEADAFTGVRPLQTRQPRCSDPIHCGHRAGTAQIGKA
eukprot:1160824-Pelagomonas_calceolata.AAC.8